MNVLITGGAGFIGSFLAERCLREGWRVSILDNFSTGRQSNISNLQGRPRFSCTTDSILNEDKVEELAERANLIFHLAAVVGVKLVLENTLQTIQTNVAGTEIVLRCAAKRHTPVIFTSTSEVYGKSEQVPFQEDGDLVLGSIKVARWTYACSKAQDESLVLAYWTRHALPAVVVRLFNTVGPRQIDTHGMVLPTFVRQALRGQPITVYGSGEQRRCFAYVGDVVESLMRIAQTPQAVGEIINIGNDHEISINDLAALVKEISGSRSPIRHQPYEQVYEAGFEDMPRRVPCLKKLHRLIGYRPTTPIENIVRRVVTHEWAEMPKHAMAAAV